MLSVARQFCLTVIMKNHVTLKMRMLENVKMNWKSHEHFLFFLIYWTLKYIQWALFSLQLQNCKFRVEQNDVLPWNKLLMNYYLFYCFWIICEVILVSLKRAYYLWLLVTCLFLACLFSYLVFRVCLVS